MYHSKIKGVKETDKGTDLIIHIPGEYLKDKILKFDSFDAEIRLDDGRTISVDQRKKIFATIKDIALYTGDHPEDQRAFLLYDYCIRTGEFPFSLRDCSMTQARDFIDFIIEFILREDIPLSEIALNRTDNIDKYLYNCIKHKRCSICGKTPSDLHHVDTIGMGGDRRAIDDSKYLKIQLCRLHHNQAHAMGIDSFKAKYHVYGIMYKGE